MICYKDNQGLNDLVSDSLDTLHPLHTFLINKQLTVLSRKCNRSNVIDMQYNLSHSLESQNHKHAKPEEC